MPTNQLSLRTFLAIGFIAVASPSQAAILQLTAAEVAAIPGLQLEDITPSVPARSDFALTTINSNTDSVAFDPGDILPGISFSRIGAGSIHYLANRDFSPLTGLYITTNQANTGIRTTTTIPTDVIGFDLDVFTNVPRTATINVYDGSTLLGQFFETFSRNSAPRFVGYQNDSGNISRVDVFVANNSGLEVVDNVRFGMSPPAVPEPGSATLALLGVSGLILRRRR